MAACVIIALQYGACSKAEDVPDAPDIRSPGTSGYDINAQDPKKLVPIKRCGRQIMFHFRGAGSACPILRSAITQSGCGNPAQKRNFPECHT